MADTEEYLNEEVTFMQPLKILSWDPKNKNDTDADITRSYTFTSNSSSVDCAFANLSNTISLKSETYLTATSSITSAYKLTAPVVRMTAIKCKSSVFGNTYTNGYDHYATTIQHGTSGDMNLYATSKVTLETDDHVESMSKAGLVAMNVVNSVVTAASGVFTIVTNPSVTTGVLAGGTALVNSVLPALGGAAMNKTISDTVTIDNTAMFSMGIQSPKIVFNNTNQFNIETTKRNDCGSLKFKSDAINMVAETISAFVDNNVHANDNKLVANNGGKNSISITDDCIRIFGQGTRGSLEINRNNVKFTNGGSSIVIDGTGVNISAGASKISIKSRGVLLDNVKVDGQKIAH